MGRSLGVLTLKTANDYWANLGISSGATFVNRGTIEALATPDSRVLGRIYVYAGGTFDNRGAFHIGFRYVLMNEGVFNNRGALIVGTLDNYGTVYTCGAVSGTILEEPYVGTISYSCLT
ncbi:MAG: hypothetical protein JRN06_03255 [Nitrososphaerota archaeon]|nr:hypothetical protein [Nitrososphaerota archaeon]MDG7023124.1 hypothetical protein [Nitrososphaerota archaeon]